MRTNIQVVTLWMVVLYVMKNLTAKMLSSSFYYLRKHYMPGTSGNRDIPSGA